jgi:hypothetical protein
MHNLVTLSKIYDDDNSRTIEGDWWGLQIELFESQELSFQRNWLEHQTEWMIDN